MLLNVDVRNEAQGLADSLRGASNREPFADQPLPRPTPAMTEQRLSAYSHGAG